MNEQSNKWINLQHEHIREWVSDRRPKNESAHDPRHMSGLVFAETKPSWESESFIYLFVYCFIDLSI